jgi:hypothetical protein
MDKRQQIYAVLLIAAIVFAKMRSPRTFGVAEPDPDDSMDNPGLALGLAIGIIALAIIGYIVFFEKP